MKSNSPHFDKDIKLLTFHQSKVEYTPELEKNQFRDALTAGQFLNRIKNQFLKPIRI